MSQMSLIANLGGMMGLCMGMSFVSVLEISYFLVSSFLAALHQSKKGNKKNKVAQASARSVLWGLYEKDEED